MSESRQQPSPCYCAFDTYNCPTHGMTAGRQATPCVCAHCHNIPAPGQALCVVCRASCAPLTGRETTPEMASWGAEKERLREEWLRLQAAAERAERDFRDHLDRMPTR